jgi:hypothetical protein
MTITLIFNGFYNVIVHEICDEVIETDDEHFLTKSCEQAVDVSGKFKEEFIILGLHELR